jgi:hypothetical protein
MTADDLPSYRLAYGGVIFDRNERVKNTEVKLNFLNYISNSCFLLPL